jgi:hypothetical protein
MTFTFTNFIGNGLQRWNVGAGATLAFGKLGAGAAVADDEWQRIFPPDLSLIHGLDLRHSRAPFKSGRCRSLSRGENLS